MRLISHKLTIFTDDFSSTESQFVWVCYTFFFCTSTKAYQSARSSIAKIQVAHRKTILSNTLQFSTYFSINIDCFPLVKAAVGRKWEKVAGKKKNQILKMAALLQLPPFSSEHMDICTYYKLKICQYATKTQTLFIPAYHITPLCYTSYLGFSIHYTNLYSSPDLV